MKKTAFLIILLLSLCTGFYSTIGLGVPSPNVVNAETGIKEVQIAFFNVPPHIYLDEKTGQVKGAVYEFLENHMAPAMKVKFVWDAQPSVIPRQIELMDQKEYASACLAYSPERAQKFNISEVPYMAGKSTLVVLKSNKLNKITKVEDLFDMKIGFGNAFISPFMKNDKIKFEIVSAPNFNELNFKKLENKRIDAVYTPDKASLLFFMKEMNLAQEYKLLDIPETPSKYHVVFSQSLKNVADRYNKAFKELDGSKLYLKILGKYIDTSKL